MTRLSWDDCWLQVARVIAQRSRCVRDQVGAVIVDPENRVIATSYNGPPAGYPYHMTCDEFCSRAQHGPTTATARSYVDCVTLHAEANGLMVCDRSMRVDGTIYVTSGVCWSCAKLIANSGLRRVVVLHDNEHGHRDVDQSYSFLRSCGLEVTLASG